MAVKEYFTKYAPTPANIEEYLNKYQAIIVTTIKDSFLINGFRDAKDGKSLWADEVLSIGGSKVISGVIIYYDYVVSMQEYNTTEGVK
jgi:hypothetical protein